MFSHPSIYGVRNTNNRENNLGINLPDEKDFASSGYFVAIRIRPSNEKERNGPYHEIIRPCDDRVLVFDPRPGSNIGDYSGNSSGQIETNQHVPGSHRYKEIRFVFDRVFPDNALNFDVYCATSRKLILPTLSGYKASMFAYGATGAGKSHTMTGSDSSCRGGVISLTMSDLFDTINSPAYKNRIKNISASYIEIYNENIHDLLSNTPHAVLPLREERGVGPVVTGLVEMHPQSYEDVMAILESGNSSRAQFATGENAQSSRSHAIFQIKISLSSENNDVSKDITETLEGKLSLIDLAGSERAKRTENTGIRLREGANINKSLLALGNCISALCHQSSSGKKKDVFIPYRNSKLTRILQDSLGGNSRTIMLANISPSSYSYEDTLNTLNYANRAKQIKASAKTNTNARRLTAVEYNSIIANLKAENAALKTQIQNLVAMNKGNENIENNNLIVNMPVPISYTNIQEKNNEEAEKLKTKCINIKNAIVSQNKIFIKNTTQIQKMKIDLWQTHIALKKVLKIKNAVLNSTSQTIKKEQRDLFVEPSGKYYIIENQLRKKMEILLERRKKNEQEINTSKIEIEKLYSNLNNLKTEFENSNMKDDQQIHFTLDVLQDLAEIAMIKIDQQVQQNQQQQKMQQSLTFGIDETHDIHEERAINNKLIQNINKQQIQLNQSTQKINNINKNINYIDEKISRSQNNEIGLDAAIESIISDNNNNNQLKQLTNIQIKEKLLPQNPNNQQNSKISQVNSSSLLNTNLNISAKNYDYNRQKITINTNLINNETSKIDEETTEIAGKTLNILSDIGKQLSSIKTGSSINLNNSINNSHVINHYQSYSNGNTNNSLNKINTHNSLNNENNLKKNKIAQNKNKKVSLNSSFVDDVMNNLPMMPTRHKQ